ncbi:MAG: hypothetical protein NT025_04380 [bacterium]|nr:hypothetical protein [bacterium]
MFRLQKKWLLVVAIAAGNTWFAKHHALANNAFDTSYFLLPGFVFWDATRAVIACVSDT